MTQRLSGELTLLLWHQGHLTIAHRQRSRATDGRLGGDPPRSVLHKDILLLRQEAERNPNAPDDECSWRRSSGYRRTPVRPDAPTKQHSSAVEISSLVWLRSSSSSARRREDHQPTLSKAASEPPSARRPDLPEDIHCSGDVVLTGNLQILQYTRRLLTALLLPSTSPKARCHRQ